MKRVTWSVGTPESRIGTIVAYIYKGLYTDSHKVCRTVGLCVAACKWPAIDIECTSATMRSKNDIIAGHYYSKS